MAAPEEREPQPRGNLALISLQLTTLATKVDGGLAEIRDKVGRQEERLLVLELWRVEQNARERARAELEAAHAAREKAEREAEQATFAREQASRERRLFPINFARGFVGLAVLVAGVLAGTQIPH